MLATSVGMRLITAPSTVRSGLNQQKMSFSKYISNARKKRLPMTTKRAGKGYYKGNGARKEGVINSRGTF